MAAAHRDSIRTIAPLYYPPDIVIEWAAAVDNSIYLAAMALGETFFVAIAGGSEDDGVLGFSSHGMYDGEHGVGVYVRGSARRRGVGTALLRAAEESARAAGAQRLHIDASLAAVEFYKANGFQEVARGEHRLRSGVGMACVFMEKPL